MSAKIKLDFLATNRCVADTNGTATNDYVMDDCSSKPFANLGALLCIKNEEEAKANIREDVEDTIRLFHLREAIEANVKAGTLKYPETEDEIFNFIFTMKVSKPEDTVKYYKIEINFLEDKEEETYDTLEEANNRLDEVKKDDNLFSASLYEVETDFDKYIDYKYLRDVSVFGDLNEQQLAELTA